MSWDKTRDRSTEDLKNAFHHETLLFGVGSRTAFTWQLLLVYVFYVNKIMHMN